MRYLIYILTIMSLLSASCLQRRSFSVPTARHLHYEIEISKTFRESISFDYAVTGTKIHIRLKSIRNCRQIQYNVESLSTIETVQYPLARYYLMIGSILAALSLPSFYMAAFKSEGKSSWIQAGIGTGVFLGPGLGIGGYGFLKIQEESTVTKHIGNVRREISSKEIVCGTDDFTKKKRIDLLTRTGPENVGFTDEKGRLEIDCSKMEPLVNENRKIRYFELMVDGESLGKIVIGDSRTSEKNKTPDKKVIRNKN